jgi:L-lactate dehydrogenase complex protein LldF
MTHVLEKFLLDSGKKAFDREHRKRLNYNISKYDETVVKGKEQYRDLELAKRRASNLKHKAIEKLDRYLIEFESNFTKRGGKVIWAVSEKDARKEIMNLVKRSNAHVIVKQKTMLSEELEINELLLKNKKEVYETDLGEFIVQIAHEKPYHIVTPAIHKSKEDVSRLFHEKYGMPPESTPQDIAAFVREHLRSKFISADIGITGGNFLIADIGAVALTENEGNGLLTIAFPRIHIAVVGIEKVIPSIDDLDLFLPLLGTHGTGQNITVYNNILTGPKLAGEPDGPEEMYVILVDNGRTGILGLKEQRRALYCIRCGACLNGCPVYKTIGGYAYGTVYSGPIGSVISPHLNGLKDYHHLSDASSLCGNCSQVCPVKIPIHELLLYNRNLSVKEGHSSAGWKIIMKGWKKVMLHRWILDRTGPNITNHFLKTFFRKKWGKRREIPRIANKSFKQLWKEKTVKTS